MEQENLQILKGRNKGKQGECENWESIGCDRHPRSGTVLALYSTTEMSVLEK
jgi:hypothetical protein